MYVSRRADPALLPETLMRIEVHHFPLLSPRLQISYFRIKLQSITSPLKSLTFLHRRQKDLSHSCNSHTPSCLQVLEHQVIFTSCFLPSCIIHVCLLRVSRPLQAVLLGTCWGTLFFLLMWRIPASGRLEWFTDLGLSPDPNSLSLQWKTAD